MAKAPSGWLFKPMIAFKSFEVEKAKTNSPNQTMISRRGGHHDPQLLKLRTTICDACTVWFGPCVFAFSNLTALPPLIATMNLAPRKARKSARPLMEPQGEMFDGVNALCIP